MFNFMTEVTRILNAIDQGDPHAARQLLPLVYDELRKLAAAKMAQEAQDRHCKPQPWCMKPTCGWSALRWKSTGIAVVTSLLPQPRR